MSEYIRRAVLQPDTDDALMLAHLVRDSFDHPLPGADALAATINLGLMAARDEADISGTEYIGAYDGDTLVGAAKSGQWSANDQAPFVRWPDHDVSRVIAQRVVAQMPALGLHALVVHPDAQGLGIGSALLDYVASRQPDKPVKIAVDVTNTRSREWLLRRGFYASGVLGNMAIGATTLLHEQLILARLKLTQ